eukprot:CAMPEP_0185851734 /NCGR_PEP_ID=MMETSP1354-20130828/11303_1 /TAXON_ID=708628 /ORGANISM="Erythrolobus madagascarensis, Strain CCMP3276" /LENGTH=146 /DNA_ID=CAMNT_0028552777 /DNA_START=37 /DNA_END=477 /DNA_ORIENTATION=-
MVDKKNRSSTKIARILHTVGSATFIGIGVLHTVVQFTTLSSDEVQRAYRAGGAIEVTGQVVDGWDLFAGTSVLMGVFSMGVGALNFGALRTTTRPDGLTHPVFPAVTVGVLGCVIATGATLLGPLQLYGGMAGLVMFGVPLVAAST